MLRARLQEVIKLTFEGGVSQLRNAVSHLETHHRHLLPPDHKLFISEF